MTEFEAAKAKALEALHAAAAAPGNEDAEAKAGWYVGNLADLLKNPDMFEDVEPGEGEIQELLALVNPLTEADAA